MRIRIGIRDLFDPGSGMEKLGSGIRNEHPGSATLSSPSFSEKGGGEGLPWAGYIYLCTRFLRRVCCLTAPLCLF
jgi:hypothetical protein